MPFSPVMRTLASDGPTREMTSSTGRIAGAAEIIEGEASVRRMRFSASRRWPWRIAWPSAICVRSVVRRRALSQGFWTKSRAPRRIASTARSTVPQAVMTMTGSVSVDLLDPREQVEAFLARGRVARVVQIDERGVALTGLQRRQNAGGRAGGLAFQALALEQEAQGLEDVALIVGDQNPRPHRLTAA